MYFHYQIDFGDVTKSSNMLTFVVCIVVMIADLFLSCIKANQRSSAEGWNFICHKAKTIVELKE